MAYEACAHRLSHLISFLRPGFFPQGSTALHLAAMSGDARCAAALLEAGAEVSPRDEDGMTPAMLALWFRHFACAELLLSRGAADSVFSIDMVREEACCVFLLFSSLKRIGAARRNLLCVLLTLSLKWIPAEAAAGVTDFRSIAR